MTNDAALYDPNADAWLASENPRLWSVVVAVAAVEAALDGNPEEEARLWALGSEARLLARA